MKKSRYTEEQIAFALRQTDLGTTVAEVCRKMGVSEATFYNWKKKYGGLGVSELLDVDTQQVAWRLVLEPLTQVIHES